VRGGGAPSTVSFVTHLYKNVQIYGREYKIKKN
jgi:hypothetical protein